MPYVKPKHRPSYSRGFARNASQSIAPGLWQNIKGLWEPSLGWTGDALRDQSGFSRHAVNSGGVWTPESLIFSGTMERAIVTTSALPVTGTTIVSRCRFLDNGSWTLAIYGPDSNSGWRITGGTGRWAVAVEISAGTYIGRIGPFDFSGDQVDVWHDLAFTINSGATVDGDVAIYVDGVQHDTTNAGTNPFQPSGQLYIGATHPSNAGNIEVGYFGIYDRVLSLSEIRTLHGLPHPFITPRARQIPMGGAAGGFVPYPHIAGMTGGIAT